MSEALELGWKSRFDIALGSKRRIVLHGNVQDYVLDEHGPLEMVDWLRATLSRRGYTRVVSYDFNEDIRTLAWVPEGQDVLQLPGEGRNVVRNDPRSVLGHLRRYLGASDEPSALILLNIDLGVTYPSQQAVALHNLIADIGTLPPRSGESASSRPRNVAIHLYSRETSIPTEFVTTDPDTKLVLVTLPSYEERRLYFELRGQEFFPEGSALDTAQCARRTEGFRFKELQQLAALSRHEQIESAQLSVLLNTFTFGRDEDRWVHVNIAHAASAITEKGVRGQDRAVSQLVESLRKAKHGVGSMIDPNAKKPAVVCFFVGPTGVGKTMVARALAEYLTGSPDSCKIIDMSEYRQDHSDQRLIGSPPGYVGFQEGGQLTRWVRSRPFSVVLIDEVEKANERILDLFLQVLDGARLTDGKGETVDFSQTVLVFTSNIGTEAVSPSLDRSNYDDVAAFFNAEVERFFAEEIERPELFNRLKAGVVVFGFIQEAEARYVIEATLVRLTEATNDRLQAAGSQARVSFDRARDGAVTSKLLELVNYRQYGMRDVNNVISSVIGIGIARVLDNSPPRGIYEYVWNEDEKRFRPTATREPS